VGRWWSAADDDGAVRGGRCQPGQVIRITGQDPVPRLGQQDDAGIDRVGGAGLAEQDAGLTAVLVIYCADVDRAQ
jgi:hypothetical protein